MLGFRLDELEGLGIGEVICYGDYDSVDVLEIYDNVMSICLCVEIEYYSENLMRFCMI